MRPSNAVPLYALQVADAMRSGPAPTRGPLSREGLSQDEKRRICIYIYICKNITYQYIYIHMYIYMCTHMCLYLCPGYWSISE